ncbi:branched-chain amino acid ABC transporter permease [Actinomadura sp. LD22]|uniref:Branched-chain amino acid ABC transporter permease n=1 Tax=Actinomadura physcomitrii TaxID=2650748 RepID=A0A6I4MI56_9ACTN|nr:ABC transporter permease [Actinomadura physcomitrii]MWA05423.1 branched-chain amino acid ABC transporter permease [Actinomadura physcomitrii]
MSQYLLFALLGLGQGALIAGLALALVLTHRGSGTINLGTGAVAVLGAYAFYGLKAEGALFGLPLGGPWRTLPALVVALLVCALAGVLIDAVALRPLRAAAPLARLLASLGVLVIIQSLIVLRYGSDGQAAPEVFPAGPGAVVEIFGAAVPTDRFLLAGVVVLAAVALSLLYRYSRFGLATRAAAENETLAMANGLSADRLSMANTVAACVVAGALGILAAAQTQLDPMTIPLAVVPALGAALLGRFTSFGVAAAAGLVMGVVQSMLVGLQAQTWFPTSGGQPVPGLADLLFFLVIVGAVLWRGAALPQRGAVAERRLPAAVAPRRPGRMALVAAVVLAVLFLTLPFGTRQALTNSLIAMVLCLSLVVITGFVGQLSLIQVALAGVSGFVVSRLAGQAGIGFPLGPLAGILAATVLGVLVAFSALRVRGVNLAMVTIAGAVALQTFGFQNPVWGAGTTDLRVPEPRLLGIDLGPSAPFPVNRDSVPSPLFGLGCAAVLIAVALLVARLRRDPLGRRMLAVRSNERAAAAAGVNVRNVKLAAFAISSAIAGLGGAMYAYDFGTVSSGRFDLVLALAFIAFAYVGGITTVGGAVIAGLGVTGGLLSHVLDAWVGVPAQWQLLLGGIALVLTIAYQPGGIAADLRARTGRLEARLRGHRADRPAGATGAAR